jgi:transcriptional antiterminator RfaH
MAKAVAVRGRSNGLGEFGEQLVSAPVSTQDPGLNRSWYLVYSKPRQERLADENLLRQGYESYLPLIRTRRRVRGAYRPVVEAMFPRYLFVCLDQVTDDWGPIRSTVGVSGLVYFGQRPAHIPLELIETLRQHVGEDGVHELPQREIGVGDAVRIVDGVMAGYSGICQARTGKERVAVLLHVAGKASMVNVPVGHLERVS